MTTLRSSRGATITRCCIPSCINTSSCYWHSQHSNSLLTLYNPVVTVRTARFSFQKFCVQPTQCVCVYGLYGSENRQRLFPCAALSGWVFGAFAKLRKATVSVVMSVRPYETRLPLDGMFMKVDVWVFFAYYVQKIHVSLKSDKNIGYFTWWPIHISNHISLSSS